MVSAFTFRESKFPVQVENSEAGLKRLWKKSWKVMEFEKLSRVRTLMLEHLDDCNTQINIGKRKRTQVFQEILTSIVACQWIVARSQRK